MRRHSHKISQDSVMSLTTRDDVIKAHKVLELVEVRERDKPAPVDARIGAMLLHQEVPLSPEAGKPHPHLCPTAHHPKEGPGRSFYHASPSFSTQDTIIPFLLK